MSSQGQQSSTDSQEAAESSVAKEESISQGTDEDFQLPFRKDQSQPEETLVLEEGESTLETPENQAKEDAAADDDGRKNRVLENSEEQGPPQKQIHSLEIDMGDDDNLSQADDHAIHITKSTDTDDYLSGEDDDMQQLLADKTKKSSPTSATICYCCRAEPIGNLRVFAPQLYARTGWGIVGPHWFGPPCVMAILLFASTYFTRHAHRNIGPISAAICVLMTLITAYYLVQTSFRDPGIVRTGIPDHLTEQQRRRYRWCDHCQNFQPPSGVHCNDCNVCVAGFDHHCVWVGCCIGRNNLIYFVRFNLAWLVYLVYAIVWVSILGPILCRQHS